MTLGIICPGQGAQSSIMLDRFRDLEGADAAFDAFKEITGRTIEDVIADKDRLVDNAVAQPLVCAIEMATFDRLKADLPQVRFFAGYSVGELAAHGCAGTFSRTDTIRLAQARASAMDAATTRRASMIAIRGIPEHSLAATCTVYRCFIAIRNGVDRFVVAGEADAILELSGEAILRGASVTRLPVEIASHTPLMEAAAEPFRKALEEIEFHIPNGVVLAGIDGSPLVSRDETIEKLVTQLVRPVDWVACMTSLREHGCETLLELLPGANLTTMAAEQEPSLAVRAVAQFKGFSGAAIWAASRN